MHSNRFLSTAALAACAALGMLAAPRDANAQQFFPPQDFNFTVGQSLTGQGDWIRRGTDTDPELLVVEGALDYAPGGLPASTGNSLFINPVTGEDGMLIFPGGSIPPADGNTYYWSAILEWDGTEAGDQSTYFGGFIADVDPSATAQRGVLRMTGDEGLVYLGTQLYVSSNSITFYAPTPIPPNQPVFAVIKLTEVPGERNDTSELFLFVDDPVPATEPAAADAEAEYNIGGTGSGDVAVTNGGFGISSLIVRQHLNNNSPGNWRMDMLRAGSTWEDVITGDAPPATSVWEWMLY